MSLLLETIWGDLIIDLDVEGSPELCRNVLKLAKVRWYTNTLIFSVIPNRFCQAGDPCGDGTGGACIYGVIEAAAAAAVTIQDSYQQSKQRFLKSSLGRPLTPSECCEKGRMVATCLANQPDTIGSQFLLTTASGPDHALDGYFSIPDNGQHSLSSSSSHTMLSLGKVTEDTNNILDKINSAYTDPEGRPYADIRIVRALVIHDPFEDIPGMENYLQQIGVKIDVSSGRVLDSPSPDRPFEECVTKRISVANVEITDEAESEMDEEEIQELQRRQRAEQEELDRKEDKSRAVVLEMLGDLPDADIQAPEDTLFICKLNPATVDEDLELILSRFDEKVKVEIIRDIETGASLQYAFAEFTNTQAATEAYFKMNNALVDDRRIKVDFSQSVAKLWDKYNQKLRMPKVGGMDNTKGDRGGSDNRYRPGNVPRGQKRDDPNTLRTTLLPPFQGKTRNDRESTHHNDRRPSPPHVQNHENGSVDEFGRRRDFQPRERNRDDHLLHHSKGHGEQSSRYPISSRSGGERRRQNDQRVDENDNKYRERRGNYNKEDDRCRELQCQSDKKRRMSADDNVRHEEDDRDRHNSKKRHKKERHRHSSRERDNSKDKTRNCDSSSYSSEYEEDRHRRPKGEKEGHGRKRSEKDEDHERRNHKHRKKHDHKGEKRHKKRK